MKPPNNDILRFIRYLSFKYDCLREQEENPLYIDTEKAQRHYNELEKVKGEKTVALAKVMPQRPIEKYKNKPKVMHNKDGSISKLGEAWYQLLKGMYLPSTTEGPVTVVEGWEDGNPNSPSQVKEWLYSMGWKPCTYKYDRNKITGEEKKIEQVRYSSPSDPRKGQLTDSVLKLKAKEKGVEELEGLTVATHRMSIFKALLENADPEGRVVASAGGFTNTLRLKHRSPIVNLPKVGSPWGEEIRGCIIAPKGVKEYVPTNLDVGYSSEGEGFVEVDYTVCGADVVSLEDNTKRHFLWDYDPDYVTSMMTEGYDPHLDLAKHAGDVTQEQIDLYNEGKAPELKATRTKYKVTNYSAVYGVGAAKLAREAGMSQGEAKALLEAYWERNWGVKKLAQDQYVKTLKDGSTYLKNPVSGFYYSLRNERDVFSTLNQGTGVYIFDYWLMQCRKKGVVLSLTYHDELLTYVKIGNEDKQKQLLEEAMKEVNDMLKLNVEITSDIQFGPDYASVH